MYVSPFIGVNEPLNSKFINDAGGTSVGDVLRIVW
jgi:hypothetical protein